MRSAMHSPVIVLRGAEGMRDALDGVHNGAGEVVGRIRLEFGSLQKQRDRERQRETTREEHRSAKYSARKDSARKMQRMEREREGNNGGGE